MNQDGEMTREELRQLVWSKPTPDGEEKISVYLTLRRRRHLSDRNGTFASAGHRPVYAIARAGSSPVHQIQLR